MRETEVSRMTLRQKAILPNMKHDVRNASFLLIFFLSPVQPLHQTRCEQLARTSGPDVALSSVWMERYQTQIHSQSKIYDRKFDLCGVPNIQHAAASPSHSMRICRSCAAQRIRMQGAYFARENVQAACIKEECML